ncbi:MAG: ABC transporter ATP-binding protein [Alphaproteobacteria bacterium]|nr:ABC transporter ATP-binding protein [Alphaproteobacteria bacterium]
MTLSRTATRVPAAVPEAAIEARGLSKIYKAAHGQPEKVALRGVDLTVPRGSIFGLLGPNGAGKSTFINILAGLVIKTGGTARIWGHDIDRSPRAAAASIGIVPQELNIDPFFTPAELLELQAGLYAVPKARRRTGEILAALGLADKADAYARTLSGGMRRRLLVGKALVHDPPVLVLDEPTAGVDVDLRRQLWDYVQGLNRRGVTIVLTTHYLEEAEALCDTIAIINEGRVVVAEPTHSLLARIDEKTLIVTPESPLAALPPALSAPGGGEARLLPDGRIQLSYSPDRTKMGTVLARLHEAGVTIADLTTEQSDLEDVFLQLTRDTAA